MDISGGGCTEGVSGFDNKGEWSGAAGANCCQNKWEKVSEKARHGEAADAAERLPRGIKEVDRGGECQSLSRQLCKPAPGYLYIKSLLPPLPRYL